MMSRRRFRSLSLFTAVALLWSVYGSPAVLLIPKPAVLRHIGWLGRSVTRPRNEGLPAQAGDVTNDGKMLLCRNAVAVLEYHALDPVRKGGDIIKPELFARQLAYLKKRGIRFISLESFRRYMAGAAVPDNAALVTFDDGYESFYTEAYPILRKMGIPAVNFVITGDFSKGAVVFTPHMTPAGIRAMLQGDPDIEVQPHTDRLHYKTAPHADALTEPITLNGIRETPAHFVVRIENDIRRSIGRSTSLTSHPLDTFAYPYGLRTPLVIRVLRQEGIHYAFTTDDGLVRRSVSKPMELPRISGGSPSITPSKLYSSIRFHATHDQTVCSVWLHDRLRGGAGGCVNNSAGPSPGTLLLVGTLQQKSAGPAKRRLWKLRKGRAAQARRKHQGRHCLIRKPSG